LIAEGQLIRRTEVNEVEKLSFEEAFKELEDTVHRLEGGGLTLDESIALFERGMRLAKYCGQKLDEAELKVSQLVPLETGGYKTVPFEEKDTL
jgi:exodeoxyribonuclease VII small subunit